MEKDNCKYQCIDCMYCKEDNYCIRKKAKVEDHVICLHFVNRFYRHSLERIVKQLAEFYIEENE